jgi:hypothetical protein
MSRVSDDLVAWLRRAVRARLALARHAVELGVNAEWTEQSSGILVTGAPKDGDTWYGTWAIGDSSITRLMEANDPQDTIVRCEAELAILGDIEVALRVWHDPPSARRAMERLLRLLGSGYRHHPGYLEEWNPFGSITPP